jgi:hypothetical protein
LKLEIIIYLTYKCVFTRCITIRHRTQIHLAEKIHHGQTKHSTQSYTNNKGHVTHTEYNATKKSKAIPVTDRGGL